MLSSLFWELRDNGVAKNCNFDSKSLSHVRMLIGPFIRACLSKTRTARINGSRLISVLDSFSCECCP